jgi:copper(I)-binding protein
LIPFRRLPLALLLLVAACGHEAGPPLVVSGLQVYAPLPGTSTGVAYMTLTNQSERTVTLLSARSPQFQRAELHETRLEDGVMKMRAVDQLAIAPGDNVRLEAGGLHLMLIGALPDTAVGAPVTLELTHDDGLVIVSASLKARVPAD